MSKPDKNKKRIRRLRFIPAENGNLFGDNRPIVAYLKDTDDPHIKKIIAAGKRPRLPQDRPDYSIPEQERRQLSQAGELADSILYSIIEATDLLLDEASLELKEQVFKTSHHALRLLLQVKRAKSQSEQDHSMQLLESVLQDLYRLRSIADEEEKQLGR